MYVSSSLKKKRKKKRKLVVFITECEFGALQIYREIGEKYGVEYSEDEILKRYRRAYEQPWVRSRLR